MAGALQAPKPARQTEADSDEVSGSESGSDDQSDDEPAAPVRPEPVAVKPKLAPAAKPAPAPAAKAPPKGVRARLQQSAAEAAAKQQAAAEEQLAAAPVAAATVAAADSSAAPDAVTAELQSAVRQSDPRLAPSASPTLPYESVDPNAIFSHVAFDTAPSYTNADAAAVSALNAESADFEHSQPDSTGRDESVAEPDFFAAPATAAAEESAVVAASVKSTRGTASACSDCQVYLGLHAACHCLLTSRDADTRATYYHTIRWTNMAGCSLTFVEWAESKCLSYMLVAC